MNEYTDTIVRLQRLQAQIRNAIDDLQSGVLKMYPIDRPDYSVPSGTMHIGDFAITDRLNQPHADFACGVTRMARNCLPAVDLVRQGRWTLDDMERWLKACIADDLTGVGEVSYWVDTVKNNQPKSDEG